MERCTTDMHQPGTSHAVLHHPLLTVDVGRLAYTNGVINITTDLIILVFPVYVAWELQMRVEDK